MSEEVISAVSLFYVLLLKHRCDKPPQLCLSLLVQWSQVIRDPPVAVQIWGVQCCSSTCRKRDGISNSHPVACVLYSRAWWAERIYAHAAVKYEVKVLSHRPGAVIPHITTLHPQGPRCLDYRAETYNSIRPSLPSPPLFRVSSLWDCAHTHTSVCRDLEAPAGVVLPSTERKCLTWWQHVQNRECSFQV